MEVVAFDRREEYSDGSFGLSAMKLAAERLVLGPIRIRSLTDDRTVPAGRTLEVAADFREDRRDCASRPDRDFSRESSPTPSLVKQKHERDGRIATGHAADFSRADTK